MPVQFTVQFGYDITNVKYFPLKIKHIKSTEFRLLRRYLRIPVFIIDSNITFKYMNKISLDIVIGLTTSPSAKFVGHVTMVKLSRIISQPSTPLYCTSVFHLIYSFIAGRACVGEMCSCELNVVVSFA